MGKTLLESSAERRLREPRVSPRGNRVALIEGDFGASGGDVVVVDRSGHRTVLSSGWMEVDGLAWSPDGREVWFTAGGSALGGVSSWGTLKELHAVSLAGRERLLLRTAGDLTLRDVSQDGRVLLSHGRTRGESRGKLAGDEKERDITYLDGTMTVGISDDGRAVLFQECAQAGGPQNTAYLRRVGDSSPIRLGEGMAVALSPDGGHAIAILGDALQSGSRFMLLSAGAQAPRELPRGTLDGVGWAWWMPDGQRVVFFGREKDRDIRSYIQQPPGGQPQPISPEGTWCWVPGQRWAPCFHGQEDKGRRIRIWELRSLDGGETRPAPWIGREEAVIAWSPDGRHAFVAGWLQPPLRVFRVDVSTGHREPWLDTSPPDPAGVAQFTASGGLTPDGRYYVYAYLRTLSDLFLVEGLP
jgi:Tol biopolymer transport system component